MLRVSRRGPPRCACSTSGIAGRACHLRSRSRDERLRSSRVVPWGSSPVGSAAQMVGSRARGGWNRSASPGPTWSRRRHPGAVVAFATARCARAAVLVRGRAGAAVQALCGAAAATLGTGPGDRPVQPLMVTPGPPLCRRIRWSGGSADRDRHPVAGLRGHVHRGGRRPPTIGDGGASYRARWSSSSAAAGPSPRIEGARSSSRPEIGAVTPQVCQVQGDGLRPRPVPGPGRAGHGRGRRSRRPGRSPRWCRCTSTNSTPRAGGVPPVGSPRPAS